MKTMKPSKTPKHKKHLEQDELKVQKEENILGSLYEQKIRPCIDLIDSLRALGVEKDLSLPAIAVIGDQSSGKSSVLEALSGIALPRGSGIVTRCPLVLKLKKAKIQQPWKGVISYAGHEKELNDPAEVDQEIRKGQNAMAGTGVGISHELISLAIDSPYVPDLTLIDLPGIARVAIGDQPQDIGDQIKRLIRKFISKQETINLVVVPSNVDIATTEALQMAQQVDPSGERTLGILTKPDLVDKGTEENVVSIVRNHIFHLKKGYMIVRCRGQQDIKENLTLENALKKERSFFENHQYFRALLDGKKATIPCLAEKLTVELVSHINKSLPHLENQIEEKLQETRQDLKLCGEGIPEGKEDTFLLHIINDFRETILKMIAGEETLSSSEEVRLVQKVRKEFEGWKSHLDVKSMKLRDMVRDELEEYEMVHRGRELTGFVSYKTFESLVKQQIQQLEDPAGAKLKKITEIVWKDFTAFATRHFQRFPFLLRATKFKIEDIKGEQEEEAEKMLTAQFNMERMVYCQDSMYSSDLKRTREKETLSGTTSNGIRGLFGGQHTSKASVSEMAFHLQAYYEGAKNRLANQVPLIIQFYMMEQFGKRLEEEMLKLLQERDRLKELLQEDVTTAERREFLKCRLMRLTKAHQKLARFQ